MSNIFVTQVRLPELYANTTSYNYSPYTIKDNKMANYFNTLNLRQKLDQLGRCRFYGSRRICKMKQTS